MTDKLSSEIIGFVNIQRQGASDRYSIDGDIQTVGEAVDKFLPGGLGEGDKWVLNGIAEGVQGISADTKLKDGDNIFVITGAQASGGYKGA